MLIALVLFQILHVYHQNDFVCTIKRHNQYINYDEPDDMFSLLLKDGVHALHIGSNPCMHFSLESQVSTK